MKANKWLKIRIVEDIEKENFKIGDVFLFGSAIIEQRETKKIGDKITYYRVTGQNIQYTPIIEKLEEV